jgi:hypothetical protein
MYGLLVSANRSAGVMKTAVKTGAAAEAEGDKVEGWHDFRL